MEAAISFHSIIIGLSVGSAATMGPEKPLVLGAALCVHQFLEGYALGALGKTAQLDRAAWMRASAIFSLSLPLGIAIAVAAASVLQSVENEGAYMWASGLMNGFCAGMLTHSGTDLLGGGSHSSHTPQLPAADEVADMADAAPPAMGQPVTALKHNGMGGHVNESPDADVPPQPPPPRVLKVLAVSTGAVVMSVMAIWI